MSWESLSNVWPNGQKLIFQTILLGFLCSDLLGRNLIKYTKQKGEEELPSHLSNCSLMWHPCPLQSLFCWVRCCQYNHCRAPFYFIMFYYWHFCAHFPEQSLFLHSLFLRAPTPLCLPGLFSRAARLAEHKRPCGVCPAVHTVLPGAAQRGQQQQETSVSPSDCKS